MEPFGSGGKREIVDNSLRIRVVREGNHVRVTVGDKSESFAEADPERFLQYYRAALDVINPEFPAAIRDGRALEFTPQEQYEVRRDVAFGWIRYYLSVKRPVRVEPDYLSHPLTWDKVLKRAEAKYGYRSADAMSLAARAVGKDLDEFALWRRVEDDRLENM